WVVKNHQGVLVPNTNEDTRWLRNQGNERSRLSYSVVSAPIRMHDRIAGVITLSRPDNDRFMEEDLSMLTAMMMTVSYSLSVSDARI
ncbi:MAG: GAF domain-containing protein, partial [Planctomycetaceae bacterium]